ncbi:hypothetical protein Hanom_Chr13g01238341 [Helianthus anomalus]
MVVGGFEGIYIVWCAIEGGVVGQVMLRWRWVTEGERWWWWWWLQSRPEMVVVGVALVLKMEVSDDSASLGSKTMGYGAWVGEKRLSHHPRWAWVWAWPLGQEFKPGRGARLRG